MYIKLKTVKKLFLVLLLSFTSYGLFAQDENTAIQSAIESKRFVFAAVRVFPLSGRIRQLTGEGYEVKVAGDSLISYLPYFGRAYTAPLDTRDGGINFTSVSFDYAVTPRRKKGWQILIRPKDNTDLREFSFTVARNGSARLQALSNNRQTISYDGQLQAIR